MWNSKQGSATNWHQQMHWKKILIWGRKNYEWRKLDLLRKSQEEKDLAMEDMLEKMDTLTSHISDLTMDKDASETRYRVTRA